jgi:hypothetical protein
MTKEQKREHRQRTACATARRKFDRWIKRVAARLDIGEGFDLGLGVDRRRATTYLFNGSASGYPPCCTLFFLIWILANKSTKNGALSKWWTGLTDAQRIRCPYCTLREMPKGLFE